MNDVTKLYEAIRPKHYELTLTPDLSSFAYTGKEAIEFKLLEASNALVFHASSLKIDAAKIKNADGKELVADATLDAKEQTVTFGLPEELAAGEYRLEIEFTGEINDSLHGWYRSKYEQDGETKWLATTQFEPIAAREAIVCIDEPAAKATFDIIMTIDKNLSAISNTEITDEKVDGNLKTLTFARTPIMSPYLLAFLVGEFEYIERQTDAARIRVYTTPGKSKLGEFALDVAAKTLDFYQGYFGIDYPLSKLDMIAVPDFAAGAMENWGAVTYRETAILVDPKQTALSVKQWAAMVVAHELAHQWFGNLVTMGWWTDLWLNEGFASWVEYLAIDHLFPEWNMWTQFVTDEYSHARDLDALANTHPIEVAVHHPKEIDEIFDAISYMKGGSVIRMLNAYLGEAAFKKGLHNYLKAHEYGNAVTADLWQALGEASGKPVAEVMNAWTSQPGHPVLWFERSENTLTVTQERFYAAPDASKQAATWPVPLIVQDDTEAELLTATESKISVSVPENFKPNPGQAGFYLIGYTAEWLTALAPRLKNNELADIDAFGILNDSFDLIKAGKLTSVAGLELVASLRSMQSYAVWNGLLDGVGSIMGIADDELFDQLDAFAGWLVAPRLAELGWQEKPGESHFDALLRPRLVGLAGRTDQAAIDRSRELFMNPESLAADLRGPVYATVARNGDEADYEKFLEMYKTTDLQEEQRRLLRALAQFKQPELTERSLKFAFAEVRSQDSLSLILGVLLNRYTTGIGWQFIQDNWDELIKRYGQGGHLLSYVPDGVGGAFNTEAEAKRVEEFFASHETPGIERSIKQALERIRLKSAWRDRDLAAVKEYLSDKHQK